LGPASGGGTGLFGLQPQPVSGANNDLTAYLRSLGNLLGTSGAQFIGAGGNILGTGLGVTQGGLGITGTGLQTLQRPQSFYEALLQANPTAVTQALAPTAANISAITSGATNQANQGMPLGGYRAGGRQDQGHTPEADYERSAIDMTVAEQLPDAQHDPDDQ
jgi:hypothetical protein